MKIDFKRHYYVATITWTAVLFIFAVSMFVINADKKTGEKFQYYPYMDPAARYAEYQSLQTEVEKPIVSNASYFHTLRRLRVLELALHRARYEEGEKSLDPRLPAQFGLVDANFLVSTNAERLNTWAGTRDPDFVRESASYREWEHELTAKIPRSPFRFWELFGWLIFWYVSTCFLWQPHYVMSLRENGCSWLLELGHYRYWLASFVWPWGLASYPEEHASLSMQWRRMYRFACLVLGTAISAFSPTAKAFGQDKRDDGGDGTTTGNTAASRGLRWSWNGRIKPSYVGLQNGTFDEGPVFQTGITGAMKSGFWFNLWQSAPLARGRQHAFGKETDVAIGWSGKVKRFNVHTSFTYIFVTPFTQLPRGDVAQAEVRISKDIELAKHTLTPFVGSRAAIPIRGKEPKGGYFYFAGMNYRWSINKKISVHTTPEFVRDVRGAFGFQKGLLGRVSGGIDWRVGKHTTIHLPDIQLGYPISRLDDGRGTKLVVGFGWTVAW